MCATDIYVLRIIQKRPNVKLFLGMISILLLVSGALVIALGKNSFDHFRLMAYVLFGHLTFVSFASAIIFFRCNKVIAVVLMALSVLLVGIAVDAFLIEPKRLEISTFRLPSEKIRTPLRILVFSDLQADEFGEYEKNAFVAAMKQKPDLILLTGDYFQPTTSRCVLH